MRRLRVDKLDSVVQCMKILDDKGLHIASVCLTLVRSCWEGTPSKADEIRMPGM